MLVMAKAPVPGLAKTRLAATTGPEVAADIAAAALLDTLDAARASGQRVVVAVTGDLTRAARRADVERALAGALVIDQRGDGFGHRLAAAHRDTHARVGAPVLQVGMDTPQLTGELLAESVAAARVHDAVLGPAADGGWWALAVAAPTLASVLTAVSMSTADTGALTRAALVEAGAAVHLLPELRDVDTWDDALAVAGSCPESRFAAAITSAG